MRIVILLSAVGFLAVFASAEHAAAVVFHDTDSITHNTTAPTGDYADSGWQYQGYFGNYLGTMISAKHFVTAAHVATSPTQFTHKAVFNGTGSDVTYTIDTSADGDGDNWWWTLPGTDLSVFQIEETFLDYAQLYAGSDEILKELVVVGRGTRRGAEVIVDSELKGWKQGTGDQVPRWGRNVVTGIASSSKGPMLAAEFNAVAGIDESHLTVGDSGGAVFIQEDDVWKLAGINYSVDGYFDDDADHTDGGFRATLFDMGGMWIGSNSSSWQFITDEGTDIPSHFNSTRISAHLSEIQAIILVPEPTTLAMLLVVGGSYVAWLAWRRRRRARAA